MRVAMVCSQAPPVYGGAGGQALALAAHLVRRGCSVDMLTENQLLAPPLETIDGVTVRRSPGERLARNLPARPAEILRTVVFTLWLMLRLARRRYDVYHVHGNYWFALAPALFARLTGVPLILKVTRLDDDDADTVSRKRAGPIPLGWLYAAPMRRASLVVALNTEIARRHQSRFPDVPVASLPNGVDVARFTVTAERRSQARRELGIPDEAVVALFVGYLTPRKGVTELLDAWHEFVASRSAVEPRAILLLVGPDRGLYRELSSDASARAASESARAAGVRLLHHLASESMPEMYAAADVFVLPTRSEGMPNSLLEALAAGLPAIASIVPGVTEILEEDADSILIDSPTPARIERALQDLLGRERRGWDGARPPRIPGRFTLDQLADTYLEVYRVLSTSSRVARTAALRLHMSGLEQRW